MRRAYSLPRLLLNALRAAAALGIARIELRWIKPQDVLSRNRQIASRAGNRGGTPLRPAEIARHCDDAAFFINRMSARVPWRSDCLVQALAGQRWLIGNGIASEIEVGTAKRPDGSFESHAWLRQQDRVVLGGDVTGYWPLLTTGSGTGRS